jgi:hypothetical protein
MADSHQAEASASQTAAFLKLLLPATGQKCVMVFRPGRDAPFHKWFVETDFDEMAAFALSEDRGGTKSTTAAVHSRRTAESR